MHTNTNIDQNSTIHNVRLDTQFTITPNATAEDTHLSFAAKGLLWYIISRPQNWKIFTWQLAQIYQGERRGNGIDSIRTLLQELKDEGYVKYTKSRNDKGHWQHRYDVYPMRIKDFQKIIPQPVEPNVDDPDQVKPPLLTSTELPSTELPIIAKPQPPPEKPKKKPDGNNNNLYVCLDICDDLSEKQKRMLMKYSEDLVKQAVRYAYHPTTKIEGGPIGRLKLMQFFLKNPEMFKEKVETLDKPQEKKSKKELLIGRFKRGETYNGYEFLQDDIGVGFLKKGSYASQPHSVKWDSVNFSYDFLKLLEKLRIEP